MYNIDAIMAKIHTRRRLRLRQLVEERFDGNQSRMARAMGYSSSQYLNRMLHGGPLSERAAWRMEAALGLPEGWMDRELPPAAAPKRKPKQSPTTAA